MRLNIAAGSVRDLRGTAGEAGSNDGLPGMQRQRERDPDGRGDALQPDLPALRRNGTSAQSLPDLPWRRPHLARESVEVRIPPGAQQGSRLRVAGKGNAGPWSAPAGDLYITLRVEPHPFFRREGDDIR